jgi:hypothetical protein
LVVKELAKKLVIIKCHEEIYDDYFAPSLVFGEGFVKNMKIHKNKG